MSAELIPENIVLRVQVLNDVRELCKKFLAPELPKEQTQDGRGSPEAMRKLADAALATEVIISVFNMFGVMSGSMNYSSEKAMADLVFTLNTNPFWIKNAQYLMPLVNAGVNAFLDNTQMKAKPEPLWAKLEYHNKYVWLELLPAIVFCLNGYARMREVSVEMKKTFENLLR